MTRPSSALVLAALLLTTAAHAAPPRVLHTPGYESLVQAGPDDVVAIVGADLTADDRVVYQAAEAADGTRAHPSSVPTQSDATFGLAQVIAVADPPYSLTARLPQSLLKNKVYRLWVVNAAGEWSEPITVNDPRPEWITPAVVNETADPAGLGRKIRVVGRNLRPIVGVAVRVKLQGPATQILTSQSAPDPTGELPDYVAEAPLPARLVPGRYHVSLSTDGRSWVELPSQQLQVTADPARLPDFAIDEPRFGGCHPGDGDVDNLCLQRAITAAAQHGGIVRIPAGTWDLSASAGFILPPNVHLAGLAGHPGTIVRHDARNARPRALFTVTGSNSITNIVFTDADTIASPAESKPIIALGELTEAVAPVTDITISNNVFQRVGRAIEDAGRPLLRLVVTHNLFGAYDRDLQLPGPHINAPVPYVLEDSIIRWNRFVPGSFLDVAGHQGVLASELGGAERVDFSTNVADGTSIEALQSPEDLKGWRAAFFWNLNGNEERLLVSANQVSCAGDKDGDGEAFSFDGNGDAFAFIGAQPATTASATTVSVHAQLIGQQNWQDIDKTNFYRGHWAQVVEGPGTGQVRKIEHYAEDPASGTITFTVAPAWDITPRRGSRIFVGRNFWQLYTVANVVDQRKPLCQKANLNKPSGGGIAYWTSTADSVIAGNEQHDTSGIMFGNIYNFPAAGCDNCGNFLAFHTGLEIRDNRVDGEYDWDSDCSQSGIAGTLNVAPTPQSPPPLLGIGIVIAGNQVTHSDGIHGGAIDFAATWFLGPPPGKWPLLESVIIQHNTITDMNGPAPRAACHYNQGTRSAFLIDGVDNLRNTVFYANRCERVDRIIIDGGKDTVRLCGQRAAGSCECP